MNSYEKEIIDEIYKFVICNNKYTIHETRHPHDQIMETFIRTTKYLIHYSPYIYNGESDLFFNYIYYFNNFYDMTNKHPLTLLIKNYSRKHILNFHNKIIDTMAKKIILITEFKKEHFIYLYKCYDRIFRRRLNKEILDINLKWHMIKDHLDDEHLKIIKADYRFIEEDEEEEETEPEQSPRTKDKI